MLKKIGIISSDVDGIFNNYPQCWLDYLATKCGTKYSTVDEAKKNELSYRDYKDEYRNSYYKAHLPVNIHNRDIINVLSKVYDVAIVTSRPIMDSRYPNLYLNTKNWLQENDIQFCTFKFKDKDASFVDDASGLLFHIDDDPQYAKVVSSKGVKVYLLKNQNWDFSSIDNDRNIILINKLDDILTYESIF